MSLPQSVFAATGRSERAPAVSQGFYHFVFLPFPLKNAALPECHGRF